MKILKSKSLVHAVDMAIEEISSRDKMICLTGGRFGLTLTERLLVKGLDSSTWEIFLTDERLNCLRQDQIKSILLPNLKKIRGFNAINFNPFLQGDYKDSYKPILNKINDINFDITFLSLGEDGHLAGHFLNSELTNDIRFCHTTNAIKDPKERISFAVKHLFNSKKVVLAVIGREKRKAFTDLVEGKGLHSNFWNKKNLVLITDMEM